MSKTVRISEEDRQYIIEILRETKDDFRRVFNDLAKSSSTKGKRKFVSHWCNLAELAFGMPEADDTKGGSDE